MKKSESTQGGWAVPHYLVLEDQLQRSWQFSAALSPSTCVKHSWDAIRLIHNLHPTHIFLDHDLQDESDLDSGMRVVEFLCEMATNPFTKDYKPHIIIHSENEDAQILMSAKLEAVGRPPILKPFFTMGNIAKISEFVAELPSSTNL